MKLAILLVAVSIAESLGMAVIVAAWAAFMVDRDQPVDETQMRLTGPDLALPGIYAKEPIR